MSRLFLGYLRGFRGSIHPNLEMTSRPHINVVVSFGQGRLRLPFLVDTGADFTILRPQDATRLWHLSRQVAPVRDTHAELSISGIGSNAERTTVRRVGLRFVDADGEAYWFAHSILFADHPSSRSWSVPSVLGRDVLRRFDLNLSYDPPSVSLTLNR